MTANQSNKLAMYRAVRVLLTGFLNTTTATGRFPALAAKKAALISLVDTITGHASTQDEPLAAAIDAREQALQQATTATLGVAGALLSYARTHGHADLAVEARVSVRSFHLMRRAERMRLAQRIHDLAQPLQAELGDFGLTADGLAALQSLIDVASAAVDNRASASAGKKVATAEIARLCAEADALIATIDPMLVQLGHSDPETYAHYRAVRKVFHRPGTRGGSNGDATDIATPLAAERQAA